MPNYRDAIRSNVAEVGGASQNLGKSVDDIRRESRGTQATSAQLIRSVNDSIPTLGNERIYEDDFADGVFDGTNQDYTISKRVLGRNILGTHYVQATGSKMRLTRTTNPAPSAGQFYFDDFFLVRVGTPPAALDALAFQYIAAL